MHPLAGLPTALLHVSSLPLQLPQRQRRRERCSRRRRSEPRRLGLSCRPTPGTLHRAPSAGGSAAFAPAAAAADRAHGPRSGQCGAVQRVLRGGASRRGATGISIEQRRTGRPWPRYERSDRTFATNVTSPSGSISFGPMPPSPPNPSL